MQPDFDAPEVLALGAWLKNAACRSGGGEQRWSALHGDLSDPAACAALEASADALLQAVPRPLAAVVHDLHPDFHSTRLALQLASRLGVPAIAVQHHHAHIAAVMAEHAVRMPVIGLAMDGVGLGTDGRAWGGELLLVDVQGGWRRLSHLSALALPGGDIAAREPWRLVAAVLQAMGRGDEIVPRLGPVVGARLARGVAQMLARQLNCPPTTSLGRWFDAAAGALGLSVRQAEEAEAAVALEQAAVRGLQAAGDEALRWTLDTPLRVQADRALDLRPLLAELLRTRPEGATRIGEAAARFHVLLADALARWAAMAAARHGLRTVCLGGGCFHNAVLTERVTRGLQQRGLAVLRPQARGPGDAALALGQAWVAQRLLQAGATGAQKSDHQTGDPNPCASPCQPA